MLSGVEYRLLWVGGSIWCKAAQISLVVEQIPRETSLREPYHVEYTAGWIGWTYKRCHLRRLCRYLLRVVGCGQWRNRDLVLVTVFRLLTDYVCLYTYEFWLSLCKIIRSSVILLLPLSFTSKNLSLAVVVVHSSCRSMASIVVGKFGMRWVRWW